MHDTLGLVILILLTAILSLALFRRWGLTPMLAYLSIGVLMGPHALNRFPDDSVTRNLADIGVIFLMFSVGLEFNLDYLFSQKKILLGLGSLQFITLLLLFMAINLLFGQTWPLSLIFGGILALSSTAIVSRLLIEKGELTTPHGQRIMGLMLFQDLAVVPLMILIPMLHESSTSWISILLLAGLKACLVLALILGIGKRIITPWFHWVARHKLSEFFILNILFLALGLAWLTQRFGLSLELGAFVGGALLSETNFRYQVEDYLKPFKELLIGLFFVTLGALLSVPTLLHYFGLVMILVIGIFLLKSLITYGACRIFRDNQSISLRTALAMAPAGEFGFVLLTLATHNQLLTQAQSQPILAASLLSMWLSPILMSFTDRIVLSLLPSEWTLRSLSIHALSALSFQVRQHVIICGYGHSGQFLNKFLLQEKIATIAIDHDPNQIKLGTERKETVMYGESTRREVLLSAGLMRASALVITFSERENALTIIHLARHLRAKLPIIVKTDDLSSYETLKAAGATDVVSTSLESSLMMATHTLLNLEKPLRTVLRRIREARQNR